MKNKSALYLAYYLVTNGFTLGLIGFILIVISQFNNGGISTDKIEVKIISDKHDRVRSIIEDGKYLFGNNMNVPDKEEKAGITDEWSKKSDWARIKNTVMVPVEYLRNSRSIQYYYRIISFLMIYLAWLYIAYQVFLVLYDIKKDQFFIEKNPVRVRKSGFALLVIALLNLFQFTYIGRFSGNDVLFIQSDFSVRVFDREFLFYLSISSLMLVLSMVFQHGTILKEEADLTV